MTLKRNFFTNFCNDCQLANRFSILQAGVRIPRTCEVNNLKCGNGKQYAERERLSVVITQLERKKKEFIIIQTDMFQCCSVSDACFFFLFVDRERGTFSPRKKSLIQYFYVSRSLLIQADLSARRGVLIKSEIGMRDPYIQSMTAT